MSESKQATSPSQLSRTSTALVGLAVVFVIALLANWLVGRFSLRADLTEHKTFTLSEGTKNILSKLETPVTLRYYVTDSGDVMGPGERARARRVEDLLKELAREAPVREVELVNEKGDFERQRVKMLDVKKLNPEPNTDAEDSATIDGLQAGQSQETGNEVYFGLAVECLDKRESLPFIPALPEATLEYEVVRAVSSVHSTTNKKVVIMSDVPVSGGAMGFQAPPTSPWMFYELLNRKYEIEFMQGTGTEVPENTSTLIVLHPYSITEEAQFAIDQYLLKGGNVIALVDPNFYYSQALGSGQPAMPGMPPQGGPPPTSNMETLFKAWGVTYDPARVLADTGFATEVARENYLPTFLTLGRSALTSVGQSDPITQTLNHLNMLTPGAFEIEPPAGVTAEVIVTSSPSNQLIGSFDADPSQEDAGDKIRAKFKPHGKSRALVARLHGNFPTAFPDGDPAAKAAESEAKEGEEEKSEEATPPATPALSISSTPGRVFLIADVDFVFDSMVVRRQQIPGLGMVIPQMLNENLNMLQNAVDQFAGDPDLINVRSRNSGSRPFNRPREWFDQIQAKYAPEVAQSQQRAQAAADRLNELLGQAPENIDQAVLSDEVQTEFRKLQEEQISFQRQEREFQKEITREFRRKLATYKFGNTLAMPILVILTGIALALARRSKTAAR